MTRLSIAKLAVGGVALAVWGLGVHAGDDRLRWVGIGLLVVAFLLRFLDPRPSRDADAPPPDAR